MVNVILDTVGINMMERWKIVAKVMNSERYLEKNNCNFLQILNCKLMNFILH